MERNEKDMAAISVLCAGRSALYGFLATAFKAPPGTDFAGLPAKYADHFAMLGEVQNSRGLTEGADMLKKYAETEASRPETENAENLNRAYTALFNLGFNSVPATASAVLNPAGLTKQEPWERVMEIYAKWGYKNPLSFREGEDHIFSELRFMEKMAAAAADHAEKNEEDRLLKSLRAQLDFARDHMLPWIGLFKRAVLGRRESGGFLLYAACAVLADGLVAEDVNLLTEILSAADAVPSQESDKRSV